MTNEMFNRISTLIGQLVADGISSSAIAITIVNAMREPTEEMIKAYGEFGTLDIDAYHAMLDSILKDVN